MVSQVRRSLQHEGHFRGAMAKKRSGKGEDERGGLERTEGLAELSVLPFHSHQPAGPSQIGRHTVISSIPSSSQFYDHVILYRGRNTYIIFGMNYKLVLHVRTQKHQRVSCLRWTQKGIKLAG